MIRYIASWSCGKDSVAMVEMQDKTSIPFRDHESIYDLEKRFENEVREVNKLSN